MSIKGEPSESWPFENDDLMKHVKDGIVPIEYVKMRHTFLVDFILRYGSLRNNFNKEHFRNWYNYIITVTNVYHVLLKKMKKDPQYKLEEYEKKAMSSASGIRGAVWEIFQNYNFAH